MFLLMVSNMLIAHLVFPSSQFAIPYSVANYWFTWCAGAFLAEQYLAGKRLFAGYSLPVALIGFVLVVLFQMRYQVK